MSSSQSNWIRLEQRTQEVQDKISEVFSRYADQSIMPSASDLYDDLDWGYLEQAVLYRGLVESTRKGMCLSREEMTALAPSLAGSQIDPGHQEPDFDDTTIVGIVPDDVEGKSLSWFVAHPPNPEIGDEASDILDQRILDLYVTHVNETGETYFPQLESQLRAYYELIANQ